MKVIFAGTPDFAVPCLQMLLRSTYQICAVYTQPDRPAGRGRKLKPSPVKEQALAAGLPVYQPENLKSEQEQQRLAAFAADLMIVVAYGLILPQAVLDIPKLGCINVHASLLPRWRGAAPIQRAIIAGDEKTGITIMQMVSKLDAGDMLHQEIYSIQPTDTASILHDKLAELGATGLSKVLSLYESGTVKAEKQDDALVTYAKKLEKSEALLDWTQPAIVLARKVRGLNAWPVAQTIYQGKALRIWQAEALPHKVAADPGRVLANDKKHLDVATGDGVLRLHEVQLPGGKRIQAREFLNAHDISGIRLG
jgi:methionyl-tRNA formyltransferase